MSDNRSPAPRIRLVITDFDGVHTDNRVIVFQDGREAVTCNRADGQACSLMAQLGIEVVILSTETNPVVSARAAKLGVACVQACADKGAAVREMLAERGVGRHEALYVGNDVNDLDAFAEVDWTVAPADAHRSVRDQASVVTACAGGAGVLRELYDVSTDGTAPWTFLA